MKKRTSNNVIYFIIFLLGLALLLYPSISNLWNDLHQTKAIDTYLEQIGNLDEETYAMLLRDASEYNETLIGKSIANTPNEELYNRILNIQDGQLGYIQIPKIDVSLPIYHGTSEEVLQVGAGHVGGSSFPIGESGTHTVLLGHRGLPSAKLFTNLPKLEEGDLFYITVLDRKIAFKVDDIKVVEPDELKDITIEEEQTYATLVTCTPYAINSHRLLVRGHKIDIMEQVVEDIDTVHNNYTYIVWFAFILLVCILESCLIVHINRKNKVKNRKETSK